jgi:hypothetical protein
MRTVAARLNSLRMSVLTARTRLWSRLRASLLVIRREVEGLLLSVKPTVSIHFRRLAIHQLGTLWTPPSLDESIIYRQVAELVDVIRRWLTVNRSIPG